LVDNKCLVLSTGIISTADGYQDDFTATKTPLSATHRLLIAIVNLVVGAGISEASSSRCFHQRPRGVGMLMPRAVRVRIVLAFFAGFPSQ